MKKIIGLFVLATLSFSCTQDLENNTPTFQGNLDNAFWRAGDASAHINEDGSLTITAYQGYETITLELPDTEPGTYSLGTQNSNAFASYTYQGDDLFLDYDTDYIYDGPVYKIDFIVNGGTNYIEGTTLQTTFDPNTPDNGAGLRLYIDETDSDGAIVKVSIVSRGDGYYPGDQVTLVGGDNNAIVRILNTQTSNGEIVVESVENGLFTGTFKFSATDGNGGSISFSDGSFYNLPLR